MLQPRVLIGLNTVLAAITLGASAGAADDAIYVDIARSDNSAYQFRASDLIGMDVINLEEETIGEVDDVIFGGEQQEAAAVIATGGFFGLGEKLVTIPAVALKFSADREYVVLNLSEEQLEALREFNYLEGEKTWAELQQERHELREEEVEDVKEAEAELQQAKAELNEERREAQNELHEQFWEDMAANWQQFKGRVQQRWGELTDDELDEIEGQREVLIGKIQERYGLDADSAAAEVDAWVDNL